MRKLNGIKMFVVAGYYKIASESEFVYTMYTRTTIMNLFIQKGRKKKNNTRDCKWNWAFECSAEQHNDEIRSFIMNKAFFFCLFFLPAFCALSVRVRVAQRMNVAKHKQKMFCSKHKRKNVKCFIVVNINISIKVMFNCSSI